MSDVDTSTFKVSKHTYYTLAPNRGRLFETRCIWLQGFYLFPVPFLHVHVLILTTGFRRSFKIDKRFYAKNLFILSPHPQSRMLLIPKLFDSFTRWLGCNKFHRNWNGCHLRIRPKEVITWLEITLTFYLSYFKLCLPSDIFLFWTAPFHSNWFPYTEYLEAPPRKLRENKKKSLLAVIIIYIKYIDIALTF